MSIFFSRFKKLILLVYLASSSSFFSSAMAQGLYPIRPITIIVPAPPGGNLDIVARIYGAALAKTLNQTVVIENKAGASTNIGTGFVARSTPDGYTLLFAGAELTVNEYLYKLPFNPRTALIPITLAVETPIYLIVRKDLAVNSVAELIAMAKASPGKLTYSSAGVGSPPNLSAELFKSTTSTSILHVPYQGAAQGLLDVIAGRIDVMFPSKPLGQQYVISGKIKLLASTSEHRLASEPNLPSIAETVPGFNVRSWAGLVVPEGTPKSIIDTLVNASQTVLNDKSVVNKLQELGLEVINGNAQDASLLLTTERAKWAEMVKRGQMKASE